MSGRRRLLRSNRPAAWTLHIVMGLALTQAAGAAGADDDDEPADGAQASSEISLTAEQQHAVGIELAHPVATRMAQTLEALGQTVDPESLIADAGEAETAEAAAQAVRAETARLKRLYAAGGDASLKMLEAGEADQARAEAERRLTEARFAEHWAPLRNLAPGRRRQLIDSVASGDTLLVRAAVLGRHTLPAAPTRARLDVDGLQVSAQVLGVLRQVDATQGVGVLLAVTHPPAGLGAGARVPVTLETEQRAGFRLPRDALLYDEHGAYVFKQLAAKPAEKLRYVRVNVRPILADRGGWLVHGVDDDDDIVVAGAGVLWSLSGMHGLVEDDDD